MPSAGCNWVCASFRRDISSKNDWRKNFERFCFVFYPHLLNLPTGNGLRDATDLSRPFYRTDSRAEVSQGEGCCCWCDTRWTRLAVYSFTPPSSPSDLFLALIFPFKHMLLLQHIFPALPLLPPYIYDSPSSSLSPPIPHLAFSHPLFLIRTYSLWHLSLTPLQLIERGHLATETNTLLAQRVECWESKTPSCVQGRETAECLVHVYF